MTPGWIPRKLPLVLALPLWIWVPSILGEYRWAILSAFPKPMPVRHDAVVFPKFFATDKNLDLPYLPFDPTRAPLGENRSLSEQGSLCFQIDGTGDCIDLTGRALGMFTAGWWLKNGSAILTEIRDDILKSFFHREAIWVNGTFLSPNLMDEEHPRQPRVFPHCKPEDKGPFPPWTDCQSSVTRWADQGRTFTFSPNMMSSPYWFDEGNRPPPMRQGLFLQDPEMQPYHKWVLCGVNGSCTELNPLVFIQGGSTGKAAFLGSAGMRMSDNIGYSDDTAFVQIEKVRKALVNQTNYSPTPVCVYPPFLFILSNDSFEACSNESCWMSQCWNSKWAKRAMVARVPRWIPVPVETPSTLSLFRQKRDFGITAAIVVAMAAAAAAATAAGIAMATTVQTSTTINQLSATVAEAVEQYTSATAQLKGGLMVINQRIDLVEERLDILFQLAQLGCERKLGALCITSVQYENYTRAANLSRELSQYLAGNWSAGFDKTLESLRAAVLAINSTRVDLSLTEGLSSWISSAFSFFKEWVGVALFGAALCCGLVFVLWLVCKLRSQQKRDKVVITQALMAIEQGASPEIWLSILKN